MGVWLFVAVYISVLSLVRIRRRACTTTQPLCAACRYSLVGLPRDARCPECNSPFRVRTGERRRSLVFVRFRRLPLVWTVFIVAPPLWAVANLLRTTCQYAAVEGFEAGWRNASVGIADAYGDAGWLFREFTPCCACIAGAAMVWPRRLRWWIAAGLLLWLARLSWTSVPTWHRHLDRDAPSALFLLIAAGSLSLRAVYGFAISRLSYLRTVGPL